MAAEKMAEPEAIIEELHKLAGVYGEEPNLARAEAMVELLAPFDGWVVHQAVMRYIEISEWYPKPSQIVKLAREVQDEYDGTRIDRVTQLHAEAQMLEEAFFQDGEYDPEAWSNLARLFEKCDLPHRAEWCREKARRFEVILAGNEQAVFSGQLSAVEV